MFTVGLQHPVRCGLHLDRRPGGGCSKPSAPPSLLFSARALEGSVERQAVQWRKGLRVARFIRVLEANGIRWRLAGEEEDSEEGEESSDADDSASGGDGDGEDESTDGDEVVSARRAGGEGRWVHRVRAPAWRLPGCGAGAAGQSALEAFALEGPAGLPCLSC